MFSNLLVLKYLQPTQRYNTKCYGRGVASEDRHFVRTARADLAGRTSAAVLRVAEQQEEEEVFEHELPEKSRGVPGIRWFAGW